MTEEQLQNRIEELRKSESHEIRERVKSLVKSGAVDMDAYEDNYLLAKIVLNAIHPDMVYENVKGHQEEVDNIKKFI